MKLIGGGSVINGAYLVYFSTNTSEGVGREGNGVREVLFGLVVCLIVNKSFL